jgi:hypothetical protein
MAPVVLDLGHCRAHRGHDVEVVAVRDRAQHGEFGGGQHVLGGAGERQLVGADDDRAEQHARVGRHDRPIIASGDGLVEADHDKEHRTPVPPHQAADVGRPGPDLPVVPGSLDLHDHETPAAAGAFDRDDRVGHVLGGQPLVQLHRLETGVVVSVRVGLQPQREEFQGEGGTAPRHLQRHFMLMTGGHDSPFKK